MDEIYSLFFEDSDYTFKFPAPYFVSISPKFLSSLYCVAKNILLSAGSF